MTRLLLLNGVVLVVFLISYQWSVRNTWFGILLNGSREKPDDLANA